MVKLKLSDLLGKYKMTQKALAEKTGIRPGTVSKMYYEEIKRIDVSHLDSICSLFNCQLSDLIEYIPDEEGKDSAAPKSNTREKKSAAKEKKK